MNVTNLCTECGRKKDSLGRLHAHIDAKHRGWGPFNLLPPFWPTYGHVPTLMEYTETIERKNNLTKEQIE